ncbi:MAG: bifunctional diguanylate cyclase/phosphodiesterase, partial [Pseudomonadales bacterium]
MSLLNQIIAAVFAVLIGLVAGTIYIMSDSSKSMLLNQLESHSQDTATHLGLYMAPYIADEDSAAIETIVNAIFDNGYYEKIQVTNFEGDDLFTALRSAEISPEVPNWFVNLIAFNTPNRAIEVTHQWRKVGNIVVKSRAGYAYEELWKGTQTTLIWFITLSLICVIAISSVLRFILRPLKGIEEQAQALSNRQYIEQKNIPKTKELRSVVLTMNSMIQRVHTMFDEQSKNIEELRRTAYRDELTGLANAKSVQAQLSDKLDNRDDEGPCTLFYTHISNLQQINEQLGPENTNNYIKLLADKLAELGERHTGSVIGRLSGADLALLIPQPNAETLARESAALLDDYREAGEFFKLGELPVHLATISSDEDTNSAEMLSNARSAIEEAIQKRVPHIAHNIHRDDDDSANTTWSTHVASVINDKKLFLQYQRVVDCSTQQQLQRELLVRIFDLEGEPCPAVKFIRTVQELGLTTALDKAVIEKAVSYLKQHPDSEPLAVNISQLTLQDGEFDNWLGQQLKGQNLAKRLSIEINESSVLNNVERIESFRQQLSALDIGFGVDNFGVHPSGFSYLYKVQPDYIKIDGSLIKEVASSAEDRFFIGSLVTVAKSLGIISYAERVEHTA